MNTFNVIGSEQENDFFVKVKNYEKQLREGISIDDIIDTIEEQYIYRLIENVRDDEHLESIILSENNKIDIEYDALLIACKYLGINIDAYSSLYKRKEKVKRIG